MGRDAEGHIKPQNGKFVARLRGEYLGIWPTHEDARDAIATQLRAERGTPDVLAVWSEGYFHDREAAGDTRGLASERSVWRTHILTARFADWPMRRVRPIDVDNWLTDLSKKHKQQIDRRKVDGRWVVTLIERDERISRQTVVHARRILGDIFATALRQGKVAINPVRDSRIPKMARVVEEDDEWTWLKQTDIERLFKRIAQSTRAAFYRAAYATAIYGGLRQGEIWGLRWMDVRGDHLQVRHTFAQAVKAASSRRPVPLLPPLKAALADWRRDGGIVQATGLVFPADHGGHHYRGYDANWTTQWRAKTGCPSYVTFHDLRHTCGSHLVMGTWGLKLSLLEVRDWLGHADLQTTQRYAHLAPGSLAARVKDMEENRS